MSVWKKHVREDLGDLSVLPVIILHKKKLAQNFNAKIALMSKLDCSSLFAALEEWNSNVYLITLGIKSYSFVSSNYVVADDSDPGFSSFHKNPMRMFQRKLVKRVLGNV